MAQASGSAGGAIELLRPGQHSLCRAQGQIGVAGIKPAELFPDYQLVSVEDQLGVAADDLEAAQGLEENIDLLIREGWLEIAAGS